MAKRMLDKSSVPSVSEINEYIGKTCTSLLHAFEKELEIRYDVKRELRFPFGNTYGWGYKYAHKSKHLCYLFFEKNALMLMLQIGDNEIPVLSKKLPSLNETTHTLWKQRYPCGDHGGWVNYPLLAEDDLSEIIALIEIKKKPSK